MLTNGSSKVTGAGAYLPKTVVKSETLMDAVKCERFDIPVSWINDMVGVKERRVAEPGTQPSELALKAGRAAIENAGIDGRDIDLVIYCSIERDFSEPATAHLIQAELAPNASCFDVANACHGIMNGIQIADAMIQSGGAETALLVTGEIPSMVTEYAIDAINKSNDPADFHRWLGALTVGDAGGALILQRKSKPEEGFQKLSFHSAGKYTDLCYYRRNADGIEGQMLMKEISVKMVKMHGAHIRNTYESLGWIPDDVDTLITHQVGRRPHLSLSRISSVPLSRATQTYEKFGNLTSTTIPVNLALFPPSANSKVLILGAGSGLSISQVGMMV